MMGNTRRFWEWQCSIRNPSTSVTHRTLRKVVAHCPWKLNLSVHLGVGRSPLGGATKIWADVLVFFQKTSCTRDTHFPDFALSITIVSDYNSPANEKHFKLSLCPNRYYSLWLLELSITLALSYLSIFIIHSTSIFAKHLQYSRTLVSQGWELLLLSFSHVWLFMTLSVVFLAKTPESFAISFSHSFCRWENWGKQD